MDDGDLQHRIEKLERLVARQRRSTRRTLFLSIAAACVGLPLASSALGPIKTDFMSHTPILASEINANFENLRSAVGALESAPKDPPVGTIVAFAGREAAIPAGWLLCDGRGVAKGDYPALWSAIENAWGDGSEACQRTCDFNLPDLRGVFLRGVSGISGRDPEAAMRTSSHAGGYQGIDVGSYQGDQLKAHYHATAIDFPGDNPSMGAFSSNTPTPSSRFTNVAGAPGHGSYYPQNSSLEGGSETRPKNAYVNFIIKY